MERMKVEPEVIERSVTGEVMYLDMMRKVGEFPQKYPDDLSEMAVEMYEADAAAMRENGLRPDILSEYDQYDSMRSAVGMSAASVAKELLTFKNPESGMTFTDFVVATSPQEALERLQSIDASRLLADDDEQLAIPSDGTYYPNLDIKKSAALLKGVRVRAWGWSAPTKVVYTNEPGESFTPNVDCLVYPSDEPAQWYQLDVSFHYDTAEAGPFVETVSLSVDQNTNARLSSNVFALEYAETGYEGHAQKQLDEASDDDVAKFADYITAIVGDAPTTVEMHQNAALHEIIQSTPTNVSEAVERFLEATWPAQVLGMLSSYRLEGRSTRLIDDLWNEDDEETVVRGIEDLIARYARHQ